MCSSLLEPIARHTQDAVIAAKRHMLPATLKVIEIFFPLLVIKLVEQIRDIENQHLIVIIVIRRECRDTLSNHFVKV